MNYDFLQSLKEGIQFDPLPIHPGFDNNIPHAPIRNPQLSINEKKQALKNSLRYFPEKLHNTLLPEFLEELNKYGHIYMYRFRPTYEIQAYPVEFYPGNSLQTKSVLHMIMNVLDKKIAQFPHELITYGGNGSVFQNWAQYHLVMKYISNMTDEQTLIINSGHPQGLFPSHINSPRVIISNGIVIPNYSSQELYEKYYAMGVSMYGEMTAGCYCYIGPQGIVHGTTLTLLNMARKFYNRDNMKGMVYVTSGLGGMSGAQPKAGDICECISVTAEIDVKALDKRYNQGWVKEKFTDLELLIQRIKQLKIEKQSSSLAYLGNIVDLWERLAKEEENIVELGSDQTSLHNPHYGGYYPVGLTLQESKDLIFNNNQQFRLHVKESLKRQVNAINILVKKGMRFWDYGNSFLLESSKSGADVWEIPNEKFKFPSYFENVMDDIFGLGFGPFRWVCTSTDSLDLQKTDQIAQQVLEQLEKQVPEELKSNYKDNINWIKQAESNKLVVGSQARILYADSEARIQISLAINKAIKEKRIKGTVVLSRDHHDVSGTDSPFRETSALKDGSKYTADMAVQNYIGDAIRGATLVALHNGGGTGWGEAMNGGFMLVLDGSNSVDEKIKSMLAWDVNNGTARRAWSGNDCALFVIKRQMSMDPLLQVTLPYKCDDDMLNSIIEKK